MRPTLLLVPLSLALAVAPLGAQAVRRPAPSTRATAEVSLNYPQGQAPAGATPAVIRVDYGQPHLRGRALFTDSLVPYDKPWRTGANAATTLVTETGLTIGTTRVPRGTNTLYTQPPATGWTLIVNRQTGQWGTQYDPSRDLVRIPMQVTTLRQPVEQFTIALERGRAGTHALVLSWENTRASVPVRVGAPARRAR